MKKFTVESKMRITFELFNDKQIEEVKKLPKKIIGRYSRLLLKFTT